MADYKLSYTAEKIDALLAKLDGGVCLPVVELSTPYPTDDSVVELTTDECVKINSAMAKSAYFLARLAFAQNPEQFCVALFCVNNIDGVKISVGSFASKSLYISTDGESAIYGI